MSSGTRHLEVDKAILGKGFPDVHEWIDSKFPLKALLLKSSATPTKTQNY